MKLHWVDDKTLKRQRSINTFNKDIGSVHRIAKSRRKQDWSGPADNRPWKPRQQRKSYSKEVQQRYWREPGRNERTEDHENRISQRSKLHRNSSPDRLQSYRVGKSRATTRNIHSNRISRKMNNEEAKIGKLQEVTGEFLGMLKKVTTSMEKIKVKFNSL